MTTGTGTSLGMKEGRKDLASMEKTSQAPGLTEEETILMISAFQNHPLKINS